MRKIHNKSFFRSIFDLIGRGASLQIICILLFITPSRFKTLSRVQIPGIR